MAAEKNAPNNPPAQGKKSNLMPVVIVALLMVVEGVGIFFLAKTLSPAPAGALAAEMGDKADGTDGANQEAFAEIELAECRPSNMMSGKLIVFHTRVSALVAIDDQERAETLIRARRARLEEGVNTIIRSAELNHLSEPGLETIKRRLKHRCDEIFGDKDLVKEVIIQTFQQSGTGV